MLEPLPDEYFMREALRQAQKAYAADEVPVGAVVVRDGKIIARAHNQVELLKDATAHAEMLALTQAEAAVGDWRLTDCDLYVTKEPCAMCAVASLSNSTWLCARPMILFSRTTTAPTGTSSAAYAFCPCRNASRMK
jgi:deoxycytidylate deaminase